MVLVYASFPGSEIEGIVIFQHIIKRLLVIFGRGNEIGGEFLFTAVMVQSV